MTHAELIERAEKWLAGSRRCTVILSNTGFKSEIVDAIGWVSWWSILIECKVSIEDFRADKYKRCRQPDYHGIGQERYYLTPPNLITVDMLPEGWGLIEAGGKMWYRKDVRPGKGPWRTEPDPDRSMAEVGMLVNHYGFAKSGSEMRDLSGRHSLQLDNMKLGRELRTLRQQLTARQVEEKWDPEKMPGLL